MNSPDERHSVSAVPQRSLPRNVPAVVSRNPAAHQQQHTRHVRPAAADDGDDEGATGETISARARGGGRVDGPVNIKVQR
ncbi:hypothetical protein F2P81_003352 [Scophthalmus maximus]|uniref:Uncharacterized protein n=1 Tax=Scophthalmus maximus TaxID=52904 RepID=A0A6A4TLV6_SCOMX|nr:hypothetical protein F2P81_003352 [Scophthalmus maximus]